MIVEYFQGVENLEQRTNKKDLVAKIFKLVIGIYREDKNLQTNIPLGNLEEEIKQLKRKIEHRDKKLMESESIKEDMIKKIETLTESNIEERAKLLNALGSEL